MFEGLDGALALTLRVVAALTAFAFIALLVSVAVMYVIDVISGHRPGGQ